MILPIAADMEITATRAATSVAESMSMSPDKIDEVRMAVVEACINAFEHSKAADGKVHLTFAVLGDEEPRTLQITVRDSGLGFDPTKVETPTLERKLHDRRKRGWGLKIIEGLMDEVTIRSGGDGTTVVMSKAI
ncbi:MAG TPA: ATP-binding protein [Thermoanaerobaculia bacterium]|nr:ATP-binding protein [Thermoanaerobaculia bacterium]